MVIQHNLSAINTNRMYGVTVENKAKSTEKLSSGYRINRAADDAAGLSISEKMRRQIRGLNQAYNNLQDGVSFAQVADGYLHEVHDMIQRTNELAVKASNGTLNDLDRTYINEEVQALKGEMKRIFHTANFNEIPIFRASYTPEIEMNPEPTDIQIFHAGSGGIGGLEFNNVRYNIAELQQKGMKLTNDGIATETQEVEFRLFDNEKVKLKLDEGKSLADVRRNYEWSADDTGVYVNDVLASTWEDLGITDRENVEQKEYSFDYHGTKITFEAEGTKLTEVIDGINGDEITKAANWDFSVSSTTSRATAPVSGSKTIAVTAANKNDINDDYYLSATSGGLAIENRTDGSMTARTPWSDYKDTNSPSADTLNGGYPVIDWGLDNDGNDKSQIKFDDSADYHFKSPNTDVQIEFDFKLAEVASQQEVLDVLDGKPITGQILTPSALTAARGTDGSSVTLTNKNITAGNTDLSFELQRDYGRAFAADNSTDTLSGELSWKKETLITENDAGSDTRVSGPQNKRQGNRTDAQTTDSTVYVAREIGGDTLYFEATKTSHTDTFDLNFNRTTTWDESVKLTYGGSLGTKSMYGTEDTFEYGVSRTDSYLGNRVITYDTYDVSAAASGTGGKTLADMAAEKGVSEADITAATISDATYNNARTNANAVFSQNTTDNTDGATLVRRGAEVAAGSKTHRQDFIASGDTRTAFTFTQTISSQTLHDTANGSTASSALNFRATGQAERTFTPRADNTALSEADFMNIKLNVPEKELRIQSGPEADDGIYMRWSPLNLTILGLSSTNTLTQDSSRAAISQVKDALQVISETRSLFGAYQNRFEHAMLMTDNVAENTTAAESRIRDTDMAKEMTALSTHNILTQAGETMLAQANQTKQGILSLLQ